MSKFIIPYGLILALLFSCKNNVEKHQINNAGKLQINDAKDNLFHLAYNRLDSCNNKEFIYDNFEIQELPISERLYVSKTTFSELPKVIRDDNDVILLHHGGKLKYHPVYMATHAITLFDIYRRLQDTSSLNLAIKHANKLVDISLAIDSTLLFPYSYNNNFYDRDRMVAPWYSAMAQGKVLSLFSRLYELTSNKDFLIIADKIYRSFYRLKATHSDWISCIDQEGNLWLEEYPHEQPSHVLNGMVFAICGIYDYYMINKTEDCSRLLKASITTIKKNMHHYRHNSQVSYYCLKYAVKNPNYHSIHIEQLRMLGKISGIKDFNDIANKLQNDVSANP